MNKFLKINFSLLLAATIFVACESDDNNDPVVPVNVPPSALDLSMAMNISSGDTATINLAATDADGLSTRVAASAGASAAGDGPP